MYKIAVVEDNPQFTEELKVYFTRIKEDLHEEFDLYFFEDGESFLETLSESYDAIYLDIQLPGKNGMELAQEIRSFDSEVILLFVTNMTQFAIQGYSVNAIDYILKPLSYPDFMNVTQKVFYRLSRRQTCSITISGKDVNQRIDCANIYYIEVQGHTLTFYTKQDTFTIRGSLKTFEEKLQGQNFSKCSNCYLINLRHITSLNNGEATVGPYTLAISRRSYSGLLKELTDYISREH